jgi:cysteine desulfurase / selenocysteine lyase
VTIAPLFDPADFAIPDGITHVCAGGETACLRRHADALLRYVSDKSSGMAGRVAQEEQIARARTGAARLWGVAPADIGFVSNVAEGVSMLAESLDFRPGGNIVIDANEYPSVVGPFLRRTTVRQVHGMAPDRYTAAVDARTRVIAVSYVSYLTGERLDLHALRRLADRVGALLVVDFTQAAGYTPIEASVADFAFSACYKWLLGITGVALAYWNRARQPDWAPLSAGWYSFAPGARGYDPPPALRDDALRFTRGNPAHAPVYVLAEALDYLAGFDMAAVQAHVHGLTVSMLDRCAAAGIPVLTPADPARHGASVCVSTPDSVRLVDALAARGVYAWSGMNRIRFSFHGYNDEADVGRAAGALREIWTS